MRRATIAALVAATALAAAALWLEVVRDAAPYSTVVPWWALALGFGGALLWERSQPFTLSELPLVLGLLLAAPGDLAAAVVAGSVVAVVWRDVVAAVRLWLVGMVAAATLHALAPGAATGLALSAVPIGPPVWAAAFAAVLAGALAGAVLSWCVAGLSRGARSPSVLAVLPNASLGLAGAAIVTAEPHAAWLLLPPAAMLVVASRAYVSERAKHRSLELLYGVARSSELLEVLGRAQASFRVRTAELVLLGGEGALRTTLSGEVMAPVEEAAAGALRAVVAGEHAVLVDASSCSYLTDRGIRSALVAPVRRDAQLMGAIVLGDPLDASFRGEDLRLLETLAHHAGLSLEFDRLERQAQSDPLTGLANRSLFLRRVSASLARADGTVTVLFLDLDDFKAINDRAGHAAGDAVLMAVARRIEASLRPSDVAARMGGDEFAVLLEDVDDHHADHVADRVLDLLAGAVAVDGTEVWVRCSVGIASVAAGSAEVAEVLRQADVAMYRAKEAGKGQVRVWSPERTAAGRHELAAALAGGELVPHFQPVVALDSGKVVAAEALARWRHPRHGLLGPASFMPTAEACGLVGGVDRAMLWQACTAAAGGAMPAVHVNLSAPAVEVVEEVLLLTGLDPSRLVLELGEAALSLAAAWEIQQLRRIGVRIAFDDFGTGPHAVELLREHPLDLVKVARPFVDGAGRAAHDRALLSMVLQVGAMFGTRVVAEGIEREDQRAALVAMGCPLGQGHLLGRPVPLAAVSVA